MDTWWIDKPKLMGSKNPTDADLESLRVEGFGVLVSLLCEKKETPRYNIARATVLGYIRHNIAVEDLCPPTVKQLERFVKLINGFPPGTKTIIHCEGGTGRTGTFAVAYWITKCMTVADALVHVRKARPLAVETLEQEAILQEFVSTIQTQLLDAQIENRR